MPRPIGIDLGTTYTLVATLEKGKPVVLPNAEGQRLTPSVVAFREAGAPIVGQAARELSPAVFSIKRRMGLEESVWVGDREYTPQELSSFILGKVKADAEDVLGEPIRQAVITVPAYFNERQREATREAGTLAGLEVLRLLNEPTAAGLAYGLEREEVHTVLVWDLGGGTFDVSILELGDGLFEVKAVSGDRWLGGDDFDERLARYLAQEYRRQTRLDPWEDPHARRRLRELAEEAKRALSLSLTTQVAIPPLGPACPGLASLLITRQRMEELAQDLLERMVGPTRQALADAGLRPQQIDRVILVGGMTRMPAVRDLARRLLGQEPYRLLDPDEAVALGAVIHAGMLLGAIQRAVLLDVLPLSLGVETQGGLMATLIPRNTPLPASASRVFTTAADFQTSMEVHVLQGERGLAMDNLSLGRAELEGVSPAPRGVPKVEVTLEADVDGIVHVTAQDLLAEQQVSVRMASAKHLDSQEIARLAEEALQKAAQDAEARSRAEAAITAGNLLAATDQSRAFGPDKPRVFDLDPRYGR